MELTILGTAAAEAWPAPFCRCDACQTARRRGGPEIRSRAGALVDNDLKIDFGPDTVSQLQRTGRDLCDLRTLVFTHDHSDHLVPSELEWSGGVFTNTPPEVPIAVYGNGRVLDLIAAAFPTPEKQNLDLREPLRPLEPVTTDTGDTILPLPADHAPDALLLRITRADGTTLFWGHDSGLYPPATLEALSDGTVLSLAVFDTTYGGIRGANRGHMGVDGVILMVDTLRQRGAITERTVCVATHFSHNGGLLHPQLVEAFLPHGILVAYDGIVLRSDG
jgi:phosphoribosyl 1,2-cyclic phosphate phosphodiesterase